MCVCVCVCILKKKKSAALLPTAFTFSFGSVSRTGDEATDGSTTLDIQVPVEITINPPTALLTADTIVMVSVTGGTATGRLTNCSNIAITCCKYYTGFMHVQWSLLH